VARRFEISAGTRGRIATSEVLTAPTLDALRHNYRRGCSGSIANPATPRTSPRRGCRHSSYRANRLGCCRRSTTISAQPPLSDTDDGSGDGLGGV
jgi:hypothetical protein